MPGHPCLLKPERGWRRRRARQPPKFRVSVEIDTNKNAIEPTCRAGLCGRRRFGRGRAPLRASGAAPTEDRPMARRAGSAAARQPEQSPATTERGAISARRSRSAGSPGRRAPDRLGARRARAAMTHAELLQSRHTYRRFIATAWPCGVRRASVPHKYHWLPKRFSAGIPAKNGAVAGRARLHALQLVPHNHDIC